MEGSKGGLIMIKRIQKMFALSEQGAKDMLKACASCILSNIVLMLPVGLLYWLVSDFYTFGRTERWAFYIFCLLYTSDAADEL